MEMQYQVFRMIKMTTVHKKKWQRNFECKCAVFMYLQTSQNCNERLRKWRQCSEENNVDKNADVSDSVWTMINHMPIHDSFLGTAAVNQCLKH
jgi:hypothetical protein